MTLLSFVAGRGAVFVAGLGAARSEGASVHHKANLGVLHKSAVAEIWIVWMTENSQNPWHLKDERQEFQCPWHEKRVAS